MRRLLLAACLILAATPAAAWRIPSYHVDAVVQPDSSVMVTETVVADFTDDPHHGIYRFIPLTNSDRFGNTYRLRLSIESVTDESGANLPTETVYSRTEARTKVGDPDVLVNDRRTYVIRYRVLRGVHFFQDHEEFYWNAIGTEWTTPIEQASCEVRLPSDIPRDQLRTLSYTGAYGSTTNDAVGSIPDRRTARFTMTRPLQVGEGMTVVVGWPKGTVTAPTLGQQLIWFAIDNGYVFLLPIFVLLLFALWTRAGRDPDTGRSETVLYDPPDELRPAEMGTLIDERVDIRDISSTIVDLASRGYLHIKAIARPGLLFTDMDYEFTLQRPKEEVEADQNLRYFEHKLIDGMFGEGQICMMSDLKNKFYVHLPALRDALYHAMVTRRYFTHRPDETRNAYRIGGWVLIAAGVFSLLFFGIAEEAAVRVPLGWSVAIGLCGVALLIAARTMPRKTTSGRDAVVGVRGFEEYLSRAEGEFIKFQEREGYFEKYLAYAMALGIADRWAKAFEGLQTEPPKWYSGDGRTFHPSVFTHDLSSASSSWAGAMTSQPRSSGSGGGGGSGFSGGSSGGGGGGGGGGAW